MRFHLDETLFYDRQVDYGAWFASDLSPLKFEDTSNDAMTATRASESGQAPIISRLPPFVVIEDFLPAAIHSELLQDSLAARDAYKPSNVSHYEDDLRQLSNRVDSEIRRSLSRPLPERFSQPLKTEILFRKEFICQSIGVAFPQHPKFEIEAVHSGDGAFFSRHIDTTRGSRSNHRVISSVYYYSQDPCQFSGGELRLYSLDRGTSTTVEPKDNSIVFFPSIFPHEVLPVSVSRDIFGFGRFSINCWIHALD